MKKFWEKLSQTGGGSVFLKISLIFKWWLPLARFYVLSLKAACLWARRRVTVRRAGRRRKVKSCQSPISNLTRLIKSHPSFQKSCHGELCRLTSVCTSVLSLTEVRMFMRVDQKYCEEQNTSYDISNDYIIIHHSVFCRCYISAKSSQSIF